MRRGEKGRQELNTKDQSVWESWTKGDQQSTKAASDVRNLDVLGQSLRSSSICVVALILSHVPSKVTGPVHGGRTGGAATANQRSAAMVNAPDKPTMSIDGRRRGWRELVAGRSVSWGAQMKPQSGLLVDIHHAAAVSLEVVRSCSLPPLAHSLLLWLGVPNFMLSVACRGRWQSSGRLHDDDMMERVRVHVMCTRRLKYCNSEWIEVQSH